MSLTHCQAYSRSQELAAIRSVRPTTELRIQAAQTAPPDPFPPPKPGRAQRRSESEIHAGQRRKASRHTHTHLAATARPGHVNQRVQPHATARGRVVGGERPSRCVCVCTYVRGPPRRSYLAHLERLDTARRKKERLRHSLANQPPDQGVRRQR